MIYKFLFCLLLCCNFTFAQQEILRSLPVRISSAVDESDKSFCPLQSNNYAQLNETRVLVRKAITDIVIPILEDNSSSSGPCNGIGWKKIAFLNMTDPSEVCPSNLFLHTTTVRGCGQAPSTQLACDSVIFPVFSQRYSRICGRVLAYQQGSTDAYYNYISNQQNTIELAYVDGVSLTYGPAGSRQHIWTFAAALYEEDPNYITHYNCPCTNTQYNWTHELPAFIGNNYFCDTGNTGPSFGSQTYYSNDTLWDGEGCGPFSTCCQFNSPPWFQTTLPQTTSDDIELRLVVEKQMETRTL